MLAEPNAEAPGAHPAVGALLWVVPALTAIVAGLLHGPWFIDDAYITFRYAEHLAAGHGLVFNPGEPVLGTTTPLFAAILALLKVVGIAVPTAAKALGLLSMAGVVLLLQAFARRAMPRWTAAAMAVCVALHPDTAFMATSGMETASSLACVLGALFLALHQRWWLAGLVAGAALLTRPDGVLVIGLVVAVALLRDRRRAWQPLVTSAAVFLPWAAYAMATYGSPAPHSIKAKRLIHEAPFGDVLSGHLGFLTQNPPLTVLLALGVVGFGFAVARRSDLLLVALWMGAYFGSLAVSGIAPQFAWYATPLTVTGVVLAAYGADQVVAALKSRFGTDAPAWLRETAASALLLLIAVWGLTDVNWHSFRTDLERRESAYLEIGAWIAERAEPGEVVFVGEVGVLGYLLLDQVVVDSSGINHPRIHELRRDDLAALRAKAPPDSVSIEGSPEWVQQVIDELAPRYVVTKYPWLHIGKIEDSAGFQALYDRVGPDNIQLIDYRVYRRR